MAKPRRGARGIAGHLAFGAIVAAACMAQPAFAQSAGNWTLGLGVHQVDPKSDNGSLAGDTLEVDVGSSVRPTITAEYFFSDGWGVEALAALPFQHDIELRGLGKVASARQLPPTVSLQYHFNPQGRVSPFLGAGVNYTTFFSEDTTGALAGTELELEDSWGLAARAGIDFAVGQTGALRFDVRWIDIDSDVNVDGVGIGTAEIDPLAYGVNYVFKY
jgi:outer membrane protein